MRLLEVAALVSWSHKYIVNNFASCCEVIVYFSAIQSNFSSVELVFVSLLRPKIIINTQ